MMRSSRVSSDEDLAQRRGTALIPVRDERVARPGDGELGAQLDVPLEPVAGGSMNDDRRAPREQGQPADEHEDESQGAHRSPI